MSKQNVRFFQIFLVFSEYVNHYWFVFKLFTSNDSIRYFRTFSLSHKKLMIKKYLFSISEKIPFRLKMTLKIVILHSANLPVLVKLTNVQTSELEVTSSLFWWMPMVLTQMGFYLSQDLTYWMSSHIKCHEMNYKINVSFLPNKVNTKLFDSRHKYFITSFGTNIYAVLMSFVHS